MQGHIKKAEAAVLEVKSGGADEGDRAPAGPPAEDATNAAAAATATASTTGLRKAFPLVQLPPAAIADAGDIRMGRRLLSHLLGSSSRKAGKAKDQMAFFAGGMAMGESGH